MTADGSDGRDHSRGQPESTGQGSADDRLTGTDDRPTVTVGSEGYRPDESPAPGTTAGMENAIPDAEGAVDWRGWLLVAVVLVAFLVVPGIVLLRPLRIVGFRTTYLVLPLLPAVVLGATAVWVAVRSRQGDR